MEVSKPHVYVNFSVLFPSYPSISPAEVEIVLKLSTSVSVSSHTDSPSFFFSETETSLFHMMTLKRVKRGRTGE